MSEIQKPSLTAWIANLSWSARLFFIAVFLAAFNFLPMLLDGYPQGINGAWIVNPIDLRGLAGAYLLAMTLICFGVSTLGWWDEISARNRAFVTFLFGLGPIIAGLYLLGNAAYFTCVTLPSKGWPLGVIWEHSLPYRGLDYDVLRDVVQTDDGSTVTAMMEDGVAYTWRLASGENVPPAKVQPSPPGTTFRLLRGYDRDGAVERIEARVMKNRLLLSTNRARENQASKAPDDAEHEDLSICGILYSPDGKLLITGESNGRVAAWDRPSGERLWQLGASGERQIHSPIAAIALSADGNRLAVANQEGTLWVRDLAAAKEIYSQKLDWRPSAIEVGGIGLTFDSTGKRIAIMNTGVFFIDLEKPTEKTLMKLDFFTGSARGTRLLWTRNDRWLVWCNGSRIALLTAP